jgi:hypothetical protein
VVMGQETAISLAHPFPDTDLQRCQQLQRICCINAALASGGHYDGGGTCKSGLQVLLTNAAV